MKHAAKVAKPNPRGNKLICVYYTGHGSGKGDWIVKGEVITLQDILDQFKAEEKGIRLLILSDCCFSG